MNGPEQQRLASPPVRRWRALLVLGLLAGLLGMHALAPTGAVHEHAGPQHMRMTASSAVAVSIASASTDGGCPGGDGHCGGGGHLHHADPTCVAAAVSGAPAQPALVPDPVAVPARADAVRSYAIAAPDGARAPPSLAELQLLRI
ncbi:hypothetical protein SAMN04487983_101012 [Streptomyces sp. yr375]|uniref:DUF6153 family protein n=1 Tax=Streptomyces sp. yr375 TaxID=1761906 RepID=UPI0008D7914C|nr:DUF6153 family protein [Streptomyces sp. yr375]SEQ97687.1 hypothetical protein SAMN04487983_101012 [Streptomyces sp. yr375]